VGESVCEREREKERNREGEGRERERDEFGTMRKCEKVIQGSI
jgi:hypothetical protein